MLQDLQIQTGEVPPPVEWLPDNSIRLVDQTLLPARLDFLICRSVDELAPAIKYLKVRGAPSIGVAAGYGFALAAYTSTAATAQSVLADLEAAANTLRAARPTAVNLAWALDTVLDAARHDTAAPPKTKESVLDAARHDSGAPL